MYLNVPIGYSSNIKCNFMMSFKVFMLQLICMYKKTDLCYAYTKGILYTLWDAFVGRLCLKIHEDQLDLRKSKKMYAWLAI